MSEESMAKRVLKKLMQKQNFFIGKRGTYHTLLKNALQFSDTTDFDFECYAWYPNLSMSLKNKLQTAQNDCLRFYLRMERRSHIGPNILKICQSRIGLINALR